MKIIMEIHMKRIKMIPIRLDLLNFDNSQNEREKYRCQKNR